MLRIIELSSTSPGRGEWKVTCEIGDRAVGALWRGGTFMRHFDVKISRTRVFRIEIGNLNGDTDRRYRTVSFQCNTNVRECRR